MVIAYYLLRIYRQKLSREKILRWLICVTSFKVPLVQLAEQFIEKHNERPLICFPVVKEIEIGDLSSDNCL